MSFLITFTKQESQEEESYAEAGFQLKPLAFFTSVKKLAVTLCVVSETGRNLIYVQRHCEGAFLDHLKTFIKVFSFFKEKKERIINDDINTP